MNEITPADADVPVAGRRYRLLRTSLIVAAILTSVAWSLVGGLVFLYVVAWTAPEGTTSTLVYLVMPFVLVPALAFTAATAYLEHVIQPARTSLLTAVAASAAALLVLCGWWYLALPLVSLVS